jgi:hypothetical protein
MGSGGREEGRKEGKEEGIVTQQADEIVISVMPLLGERKKSRDKLNCNILKIVNSYYFAAWCCTA